MSSQSSAGESAPSELREGLRRHVQVLGSQIGERNVLQKDELEQAAHYVENELASYGYSVQTQHYVANSVDVRNIWGEKKGNTKPDEVLVIGAHYDSVIGSPGANDNGSGVAAVLELAKAFANAAPARTLQFVLFVNEEPPFFQGPEMGSFVYAQKQRAEKRNVVGMMSLETIGYYSDEKGSQHYPGGLGAVYPSTGNFIGFVSDFASEQWMKQVEVVFRMKAKFPAEGLVGPSELVGVGWSDHWSFSQMGYPGLMVTDTAPFRYPHYHMPQDTPDKIDYERMARVVAGLRETIVELAK